MEKIKKGNILLKILGAIIILAIGVGVGYLSNSYIMKADNKKEMGKNSKKEVKTEVKTLSVYDSEVLKATESFEKIGVNASKKFNFNIKDINKKEVIMTAILGLDQEQINYCAGPEKKVSLEDLNNKIAAVVKDQSITIDDIKDNMSKTSYTEGQYGYMFEALDGTNEEYAFTIKDGSIYIIGACGYEGPTKSIIETQPEKAELNGDILTIYEKVAFGKTEFSEEKSGFVHDFYTEQEYTKKIETIEMNEKPDFAKYNTYKLKFQKENNVYYFISSELDS